MKLIRFTQLNCFIGAPEGIQLEPVEQIQHFSNQRFPLCELEELCERKFLNFCFISFTLGI